MEVLIAWSTSMTYATSICSYIRHISVTYAANSATLLSIISLNKASRGSISGFRYRYARRTCPLFPRSRLLSRPALSGLFLVTQIRSLGLNCLGEGFSVDDVLILRGQDSYPDCLLVNENLHRRKFRPTKGSVDDFCLARTLNTARRRSYGQPQPREVGVGSVRLSLTSACTAQ
jgi:hypothetical protein